jgi:hypothetical protein
VSNTHGSGNQWMPHLIQGRGRQNRDREEDNVEDDAGHHSGTEGANSMAKAVAARTPF